MKFTNGRSLLDNKITHFCGLFYSAIAAIILVNQISNERPEVAKEKKTLGRPSTYSDEIVQKAREYLETYEQLGHAVPSVAGLSLIIKKRRSTIYEWAGDADKKPFSDILDEINATQEQVALSKGLKGDYNANLVKLLLGKHGYSDKVETQSTVTFENASDEEIDARIQALLGQ